MSTRTATAQVNAAGALLAMATAFRHLPAPAPRLERLPKNADSTEYTWGVTLALHDSLGHFEQWREALGFDPAAVGACLDDDYTNWLVVAGTWAGVPVQLLGYFRFQDPEHARRADRATGTRPGNGSASPPSRGGWPRTATAPAASSAHGACDRTASPWPHRSCGTPAATRAVCGPHTCTGPNSPPPYGR